MSEHSISGVALHDLNLTAVALCRAILRQDQAAVEALLIDCDRRVVVAMAALLVHALGPVQADLFLSNHQARLLMNGPCDCQNCTQADSEEN